MREIQRLKGELDKMGRDKAECLNKVKISYEETFNDLKNNIETLSESIESKNKNISSLKKSHCTKVKEL